MISNENGEDEDSNEISKLTVKEFKEIFRACNLPASKRKDVLIARIAPFVEVLHQTIEEERCDVDKADENFIEDIGNVDGSQTFVIAFVFLCNLSK